MAVVGVQGRVSGAAPLPVAAMLAAHQDDVASQREGNTPGQVKKGRTSQREGNTPGHLKEGSKRSGMDGEVAAALICKHL